MPVQTLGELLVGTVRSAQHPCARRGRQAGAILAGERDQHAELDFCDNITDHTQK